MFSRRGVEFPLVGGPPQGFKGRPGMPSWAWISLARLEKSLPEPAISCDGEPAPDRELPVMMPLWARPKGDLADGTEPSGAGALLADGECERWFWGAADGWWEYPGAI